VVIDSKQKKKKGFIPATNEVRRSNLRESWLL